MEKHISLYQLGNEYQQLVAQLYDPETGEINEEIENKINEVTKTTEEKCLSVYSWIKNLESEKREVEHLAEELIKRLAAYQKEISKYETYLKTNMERLGIKEIKCPYFTMRIKKNPYSTDIINQDEIPERFIKTREIIKVESKPDKNAIKEEVIKTGIQIPGAIVEQKTKLEILIDKI